MNKMLVVSIGFALSWCAVTQAVFAQQADSGIPQQSVQSQTGSNPQPVLSARETQVQHATILMATKHYDEAINAYQDLLRTQPKNAVFLNMVGIAYLNLSDFNQARKYFERSAKADKKYPSAANNIGMVWYQQKNYGRAIREYKKAIAIDPLQASTHANLGFAYYNTKKYPEAFAEFHKAIEIDPLAFEHNNRVGTMLQDRSVSNHGMFFFLMAKEYAKVGDAEHCAAYLRKALDEGYPDVRTAQTDPDFKKVVADPMVQAVLLLVLPADSATPAASAKTPGA